MTSNGLEPPAPASVLNALGGGTVELREDAPLKRGGGVGGGCGGGGRGWWGASGGRAVAGAFSLLSLGVSLALAAQLWAGEAQLPPHGALSSPAALCSRAATTALKAGGEAIDAAAAAALCLAVVAPHRTSLDATGSLLYWEYREARTQQPVLYEWGGPGDTGTAGPSGERPPRTLAALAYLHSRLGKLPWSRLLQPVVQLATAGFPVSEGLALAGSAAGRPLVEGTNMTSPELALYLASFLSNTSAELSARWGGATLVRASPPARVAAGAWRVVAGGPAAAPAARALQAALDPPPANTLDAQARVVRAIQLEALAGGGEGVRGAGGVSTGLAAVDHRDNYVALVTGLSVPFGSGPPAAAGWHRDEPPAPIDVAPAFLLDDHVCGSRYVLGAESWWALAQAGAALAVGGSPSAVEGSRVALGAGGTLVAEGAPPAPSAPAVNVVLQRGDALSSHADSRGGGLASRF